MENLALLHLLESVLGQGHKTSKGNYAFKCPFCNHEKPKLEINLIDNELGENRYQCWVCSKTNNTKGKTIKSLFKKLNLEPNKISELKYILNSKDQVKHFNLPVNNEKIELPKEFISLSLNSKELGKIALMEFKRAKIYLKSRKINDDDILKYNIGFCISGKYQGRIIIPSYDKNGNINYFIARDYTENLTRKYDNPPVSVKNIIGFELYINWDAPIILVEGIFDALSIKRNVIPLFGKTIHRDGALIKKLIKSSVKKIYICLDNDAIKDAIITAEYLMNMGKEVYLVDLNGKDASEVGFEKFLNTIEQVVPLTFQTLLDKKLEII